MATGVSDAALAEAEEALQSSQSHHASKIEQGVNALGMLKLEYKYVGELT